jgi:hypothetical protein
MKCADSTIILCYKFQATLFANVFAIVSQLIKPSPFTSLWGGSASVDFILCLDQRKIIITSIKRTFILTFYLSYIHLGFSVCHPVCHPVIFLSSCHSCGTLSYSLCFSNQTDHGDEMEGLQREGL